MNPPAVIVLCGLVLAGCLWVHERVMSWWERRRPSVTVIELAPRADHDPPSCWRVTPHVYDWQHEAHT